MSGLAGLSDDFRRALTRLPAEVCDVLLNGRDGDAAALLEALSTASSNSSGELLCFPRSLSNSSCASLRAAVDERRSVAKDSVDHAPEHQLNLTVEVLTRLIGKKDSATLLSLPGRLRPDFDSSKYRIQIFVRRYTRDTRPWIQFHNDNAAFTVNVALAADKQHEGGRLICVVGGELRNLERDKGEATVHPSTLLHAVTAMRGTGVRYSLIVFFHSQEEEAIGGGAGADPSGLMIRVGRGARDRRALVPSADGFGSAWLFASRAVPTRGREWVHAREAFNRVGFAVLDDFLGFDAAIELHEDAWKLYLTQAEDFSAGGCVLAPEDTRLPKVAAWTAQVSQLIELLTPAIPKLRPSRPVLAVGSGGGGAPGGRSVLTVRFYLNPGWMGHVHGGCLRVKAHEPAEEASTIAPVLDRLVVHWSDERSPLVEEPPLVEGQRDGMALIMGYEGCV